MTATACWVCDGRRSACWNLKTVHDGERLHDVVIGKDKGKDFEHLSESERKNIREILLETKKDLPDYWK